MLDIQNNIMREGSLEPGTVTVLRPPVLCLQQYYYCSAQFTVHSSTVVPGSTKHWCYFGWKQATRATLLSLSL